MKISIRTYLGNQIMKEINHSAYLHLLQAGLNYSSSYEKNWPQFFFLEKSGYWLKKQNFWYSWNNVAKNFNFSSCVVEIVLVANHCIRFDIFCLSPSNIYGLDSMKWETYKKWGIYCRKKKNMKKKHCDFLTLIPGNQVIKFWKYKI